MGNLVDEDEINKWISIPLDRIKRWLRTSDNLPPKRMFEFYASTGYTDGAQKLIKQLEESHKIQPMKFYTGRDILEKLQIKREQALINVFKEQFCK